MNEHAEPIWTDETLSPGYVWLSCAAYGLPDNTNGQIGYHCVYRPLAVHANGVPMYTGNEAVTDAIRADIRAYYARQAQQAQATRKVQREEDRRQLAHIQAAAQGVQGGRAGITQPCPACNTYCAGDCQSS